MLVSVDRLWARSAWSSAIVTRLAVASRARTCDSPCESLCSPRSARYRRMRWVARGIGGTRRSGIARVVTDNQVLVHQPGTRADDRYEGAARHEGGRSPHLIHP